MGYSQNCVVCLRENGEAEWRVWFNGALCSPSWQTRGPAIAYLNALARGVRKPEYAKLDNDHAAD